MSYTNIVLTAMHPKCVYRPCDLVSSTHLRLDDIRVVLKLLEKGNMVEVIETGEYRRKKLYSTKQKKLF